MPKIVLIQPPMEDFYLTAKRTIPYGLACIAGSLRENGFSVEIFDSLAVNKSKIIELPQAMDSLLNYYGEHDISPFSLFHHFRHYGYSNEHIGSIIREKKPFLVGISSLFTPYSRQALKTAESVKRFYPQCKIVMGGHHPTHLPEKVMESKHVDFVLRGEGEQSMPALAKALLKNDRHGQEMFKGSRIEESRLEQIPGIVFRRNDSSLYINEPAWIKNSADFSMPAMDLINWKFYQRKKRKSTIVVASRGCPMKCSYCSVGADSSPASVFRQRNVEDVVKELQNQTKEHDIGFVDFEDENLTLNKKWFLSFLAKTDSIFKNNNIELRAMNGLFPPSLDDEVIKAMKNAGFKTLNLSLGSTSEKQLAKFQRPDVRKSFEKALLLAEKHSMETVSYIIAGAPGQKSSDSVKDLLYLARARTLIGLSIFYPAPGSADYTLCEKKGLLPESFLMMRSTAFPISDTTTSLESATLLRIARILNFMKSIVDRKEKIPLPKPWNPASIVNANEKNQTGKKLLSWFLYDGKIRGVTKDNHIFTHAFEKKLTKQFIHGIKAINLRGVIK
ncbi:MAG: radical SAM protein [Thermodesulfobacteriota bacterium]|nr:radical SAM protein [Thermodesulfobacteriota bacterium]